MHFPKPFFRTARNAWFVQIGDRQIKLAADKDEAFTRYHELMAKPSLPEVTQSEAQKLVVVIVDEFLDWSNKHRATAAALTTMQLNVRNKEKAVKAAAEKRDQHQPWLAYFTKLARLVSAQQNEAISSFTRE